MKSARNWYRQLGEYRTSVSGKKIRGVIGVTMHLIHMCGKNIVVEAGIGFDKNGEFQVQYVPDGNGLVGTRIDMIILTHKHLDHSGYIGRIVRLHPEALVFMTSKCFDGTMIALEDSLKIAESDKMNAERNNLPVPDASISEEDLVAFCNNPNLSVFDAPYWLDPEADLRSQWPGWEIGFYDAGHDVGAVSVYMILPNGEYFYLTGDVASHDQENARGVLTAPDNFLGDFFDRPGTMVTEATNGGRRTVKSIEQLDREVHDLLKRVETRGGIAFFPVFAATKGGNVAVKLNNLGYKVVVDGLARRHLLIEVSDAEERIRDGRIVLIGYGDKERDWKQRNEYATSVHGFVPIIAPSATLDQGFAASAYAPKVLPGEKNAAIFTGHVFDNSKAEELLKIKRGRTIKVKEFTNGKLEPVRVNVRCDVVHFPYSSHDYQDGLVERVRLARPKTLIVHHCPSKAAFNVFAQRIQSLPHPPKKLIWGLNGRKIFI